MTEVDLSPLKPIDIEFIIEYVDVLAPIVITIDRLQGEKTLYYGELLPNLLLVEDKLSNLNAKELKYCKPLIKAVSQAFHRKFETLLNLRNEQAAHEAIIASVSHPYFKLRWISISSKWRHSHQEKEERVKKVFLDAENELATELSPSTNKAVPVSVSSESKEEDYFGFGKSQSGNSLSADVQAAEYLNDVGRNLNSLNKFPLIKSLFLKYNTTIPSSAPVERLFSYAGMILAPKISSLSDKTFERLLLLRANKNVFKQ